MKYTTAVLSPLICLFLLSACNEGLGVNITLKSKDKDTGSSQAVSLDVEGQDVKFKTAASDVKHLADGRKMTLMSEDSVTLHQADTNVEALKKFPRAFEGKWVGFHTGETIEPWQAREVCNGSYENNYQERVWVKTFDFNGQKVTDVLFYEDLSEEEVSSYETYSSNHIKGVAIYKTYEMGEGKPVNIEKMNFEYRLEGDYLYGKNTISGHSSTVLFLRCPA